VWSVHCASLATKNGQDELPSCWPFSATTIVSAGLSSDMIWIVKSCVEFLSEKGMKQEGLFRVPGSKKEVEALTRNFTLDPLRYVIPPNTDPNAVASLLKSFLRDLPTPLISSDLAPSLSEAFKLQDPARTDKVAEIINGLPKYNKRVLKYLFSFLVTVCQNSDYNKMTQQNIGVVFGPTVIWQAATFDVSPILIATEVVSNLVACWPALGPKITN